MVIPTYNIEQYCISSGNSEPCGESDENSALCDDSVDSVSLDIVSIDFH